MELLNRLFQEFNDWAEFLPLKLIGLPFVLLHELCHYTVAWFLGLNPEFHLNYVWVEVRTRGMDVMVTAAPIVFGYGLCLMALFWGFMSGNYFVIPIVLLWNVAWQMQCGKDYRQLVNKSGG
jgi:hypothetical protein